MTVLAGIAHGQRVAVIHRLVWRGWTLGAFAFAVGYGLFRLYWAAGGRWGYTACDRSKHAAGIATGCGAEELVTLPFWQGWGVVALCGLLAAMAALARLRPGRAAAVGLWGACAALVALSFPMHLLFEIPAAVSGRPTDWRDLLNRLLLLGGGLLFGAAAAAVGPRRCVHTRADVPRPVPAWVRRWAYAAVAVPLLGWTVPHALWVLGVPFGISADEIIRAMRDIGPSFALAVTVIPPLGSLLTLGLVQRWGQVFPRWMPWLAGRRVPRELALVPASVVAVSLTCYGLIGIGLMSRDLRAGRVTWSQLASGWAVVGTELVFLAWGVSLAVTTVGYHLVTRARCEVCQAALKERSPQGRRAARPAGQCAVAAAGDVAEQVGAMIGPLVSWATYRRAVHLLLNGVILLPYVLLGVTFTQLWALPQARGPPPCCCSLSRRSSPPCLRSCTARGRCSMSTCPIRRRWWSAGSRSGRRGCGAASWFALHLLCGAMVGLGPTRRATDGADPHRAAVRRRARRAAHRRAR
jgi:hypothetical protein